MGNQKAVYCLFLLWWTLGARAQSIPVPSLPWWQQSCLQARDAFSFTANQALLAAQQDTRAGATIINRYYIKGLHQFAGAVAFRAAGGGGGISVIHSGYTGYANSQAGMAFGKKLTGWADLGLQFNVHHLAIAGYGQRTMPGFEMGFLLHPSDNLVAGIQVRNPVALQQTATPESFYCSHLGYQASSIFFIMAALVKEGENPADTRIHLFYQPSPVLFTGIGYSSAHKALSFVLGVHWRHYGLHIFSALEQPAGISSGLQLLFSSADLQKKKE